MAQAAILEILPTAVVLTGFLFAGSILQKKITIIAEGHVSHSSVKSILLIIIIQHFFISISQGKLENWKLIENFR
jgi:hypothetical protein